MQVNAHPHSLNLEEITKMEPNFFKVFLFQLFDMQIEGNYLRKKKRNGITITITMFMLIYLTDRYLQCFKLTYKVVYEGMRNKSMVPKGNKVTKTHIK